MLFPTFHSMFNLKAAKTYIITIDKKYTFMYNVICKTVTYWC